jgi:glycosyltransferase involved in cell wall biosynthesis
MEAYLFRFAKELLNAGHQLHVITSQTDPATEAIGANIHAVQLPKHSKALALLKFEREARRYGNQLPVDVTIGFGRTTQHDLHRAGAGCHAAYIPLLNPFKRKGIKCQLELKLERDLYTSGRTRQFIVNSALVQEQIMEHYAISSDAISIIHTAVDTEYFRPAANDTSRQALRESLGAGQEKPVLLFAARSHRRKGLATLLAAWPEIHALTGAQLWIAGPGIKRFIKALPAEMHDTISVFTGLEDILHLYQAADLFVHPTLYDASANTVLQSMACGLPGIISAADGARQFIDDGSNGWLLDTPGDHLSLTELVVDAINNGKLSSMGEKARQRVLPLTWEAHIEAWKNQFEKINQSR